MDGGEPPRSLGRTERGSSELSGITMIAKFAPPPPPHDTHFFYLFCGKRSGGRRGGGGGGHQEAQKISRANLTLSCDKLCNS